MVEIGASGKHGRFPQTFSEDHHQQACGTEPGDLLQLCRRHGDKQEVETLEYGVPPLDAENEPIFPKTGTVETTLPGN